MKSGRFSKRREAIDLGFNMTPMIDVAFQLIIFFILASQMASETLAKLELHRPYQSVAVAHPREAEHKAIVNVVPVDDDPTQCVYKIDGQVIPSHRADVLLEVLRAHRAGAADQAVEIRADRRVIYRGIEPVMELAGRAGYSRMNITALLDSGGGR